MHPHRHTCLSLWLLHLRKHQHTHAPTNLQPKHLKPKRACGAGSQVCSAAIRKKKPNPLWATKSQASVKTSVPMAAVPTDAVAVVVAVVVVVSAQSAARKAAMSAMPKAVTSATPKALRPVVNVLHAANVQSVLNAM